MALFKFWDKYGKELTLILLNQDMPCLRKQVTALSVGFFNQLASEEAN